MKIHSFWRQRATPKLAPFHTIIYYQVGNVLVFSWKERRMDACLNQCTSVSAKPAVDKTTKKAVRSFVGQSNTSNAEGAILGIVEKYTYPKKS